MATIPPFNWRVPLRSDKPAGAQQMTDLASDIGDTLTELLGGLRIRRGFSRADNAGLFTLTFPAGEWSGQPVVIGQATEINGSQVILKGGGSATSVTLAVQNNSGQPVPLCYLSWIAVGVPGE